MVSLCYRQQLDDGNFERANMLIRICSFTFMVYFAALEFICACMFVFFVYMCVFTCMNTVEDRINTVKLALAVFPSVALPEAGVCSHLKNPKNNARTHTYILKHTPTNVRNTETQLSRVVGHNVNRS